MAELSDAEVFGATAPPPAAPRELSDAEIFGLPGYHEPGTDQGSIEPDPRITRAVASAVPRTSSETTWAAPVGGEFGDLSAQPWARGAPVPEGTVAPAARIARAAVEGWNATEPVLTPEIQAAQNRLFGPVGGYLVNAPFGLA